MALKKFIDIQVGSNIKEIRTKILGMTQEDFGKWLEYSQDTIAKWEKGQIPPALVLKRITERSKKSVDWILGLKGPWDPYADLEPHQQYLIQEMAGEFRAKKNTGKRSDRQSKG